MDQAVAVATATAAATSVPLSSSSSSADERNVHALCSIIFDSAQYLYLPNTTGAMGVTYLHHFIVFTKRSTFTSEEQQVVLSACVYLACKVSENHRSMRDVYNVISILIHPEISIGDLDQCFTQTKPMIVEAEHQLLRVMRFNVEVDLPHTYFLNMARYFRLAQDPIHIGWTLLNDTMSSSRFITTKPELLAAACLLIGAKMSSNAQEDEHQRWCRDLGIAEQDLLSTCDWALSVWESNKN